MLEVMIQSKDYLPPRGAARAVLRDIAFRSAAGEVLALLGPSGIGKSTMLRIILGLDRDFTGSVRLPPGRPGVMFQEPRLLPWLSVEANLLLVQPYGVKAPDIAALLEAVMLPPVRAMMPSSLSLGMARRVALARALAVDPAVLVLDEPFASLDQGLAAALGARIADRARRCGTLVLLSTHDVEQALATASRILVIAGEPGTLAADFVVPVGDGAAIELLRQELVARFTFLGRNGAVKEQG
jgi:sulfonate transport system ATP-binding protein